LEVFQVSPESKSTNILVRDPQTREEWQDGADYANLLLTIESGVMYGLIKTTMRINQDRCVGLLERAKQQGIHPADAVEVLSRSFAHEIARRNARHANN
jgi:hypothetical protein